MNAPAAPSRTARAGTKALWGALLGLGAALLLNDLRLAQAISIRHDRALLVPVVVAVGAILALLRLRVVMTVILGIVAVVWVAVAFTPLDLALAQGLPRVDPLAPTDAIYVLASDVRPSGNLSIEAHTRLVHGLELVGQGLAPRLVLGELAPPHGRYADTAQKLLDALHLTSDLRTIGPVADTHDEAVLLAELCRQNGWHRVLLVTSQLHSRRAAAVFEAQGLEVVSSPAHEATYDLEHLSTPDERLRAFPDIVHETLGMWVYRRRGWLDRRPD